MVPVPSPGERGHRLLINPAAGRELSQNSPSTGVGRWGRGAGSELGKAVSRTGQLGVAAPRSQLCPLTCFCSRSPVFGHTVWTTLPWFCPSYRVTGAWRPAGAPRMLAGSDSVSPFSPLWPAVLSSSVPRAVVGSHHILHRAPQDVAVPLCLGRLASVISHAYGFASGCRCLPSVWSLSSTLLVSLPVAFPLWSWQGPALPGKCLNHSSHQGPPFLHHPSPIFTRTDV